MAFAKRLFFYAGLFIMGVILFYMFKNEITGYVILQDNTENLETKDAHNKLLEIPAENASIVVYFCPSSDCENVFLDVINNAQESIHCAFYDLDNERVINNLSFKSQNLDVRLVLDSDNVEGQVYGEGIVLDTKKQYMHNKFCIIDDKIAITGSANPTNNDFFKNNNNIVVINSSFLVANYNQEFDELWHEQFGKGDIVRYPVIILNNITVENYFCPEDKCEEHIVETLDKARKSIYFMTFSFTSDEIEAKLIEKFNQRIDIKGVFEKRSQSKDSAFFTLNNTGVPIIFDRNPKTMHHKVFIVDEEVVVTGSYNPTKRGAEVNDENMLIIHDKEIAQQYLDEFYRVYSSKT